MSKPRPPYLPGQYYHFVNRGHDRVSIFQEDENYLFVLRKLKHYTEKLAVKLIAYCLLPNHYHLLVRQEGDQPAGLLPQRVFNSYSKAYNHRYEHTGTLFEGNYRVVLIENDTHFLHLCAYIHANPVKHQFVKKPEDWPYSNYLEWIGERRGSLYDPVFVSQYIPNLREYRQIVEQFPSDESSATPSAEIGATHY